MDKHHTEHVGLIYDKHHHLLSGPTCPTLHVTDFRDPINGSSPLGDVDRPNLHCPLKACWFWFPLCGMTGLGHLLALAPAPRSSSTSPSLYPCWD